jgi:hypothetical protein
MFRQSTTILMLAASLVTAPAHAQLARSGGQTTTTCAPTVTICDVNWSVQWFGLAGGAGGTLANAAIVTSIPSPPWAPNIAGVQQWIGAANSGTVGGGSTRYYFQSTFTSSIASVLSFGLGWDNRLVGAYVGGSIDPVNGLFLGGLSLLGATSPSQPYAGGKAGFCRSDGVFPASAYPNCVLNVAIGVNAQQLNKLTFVVEGDGVTDGLLVGAAFGELPPVIQVPTSTAPEPATMGLVLIGLLALGGARIVSRGRQVGMSSTM